MDSGSVHALEVETLQKKTKNKTKKDKNRKGFGNLKILIDWFKYLIGLGQNIVFAHNKAIRLIAICA